MANRNYPKNIAATTAIPFDNPVTAIPVKTITGATVFTKVTTGAQVGYGAIIRVVADGSNLPNFGAFKKMGTGNYDNTNGVVNLCIFMYDGTDYNVMFTQPTTIAGGLVTLNVPNSFTAVPGGSGEIVLNWADTNTSPNETGYKIYFNGVNDFGSAGVLITKPANSTTHTHTGLTPGAPMYYWILAVGDGVTTSDSTTAAANANAGSGGGTFPTANRIGYWKEADMVKGSGIVTSWPETTSNGKDWTAVSTYEPTDATTDGMSNDGTKQMTCTPFNVAAGFTMYAWVNLSSPGPNTLRELVGTASSGYFINMDNSVTETRPAGSGGSFSDNANGVGTGSFKVVVLVNYGGATSSELYVDGSLVGSFDANNVGPGPYSVENLFGENPGGGAAYNFKGSIKRLALFSTTHNAAAVASNSTTFIA